MAYGISRAMIPPLHTSCRLRVLFFFFFITIKAVLDCLNLQSGIDGWMDGWCKATGHILLSFGCWVMNASTAGLHGAYT